MTPRHRNLTLLLRCLHDLDYTPPTWTGQLVARQSQPGEGPSTRIDCHTCRGQGEIRRRGVPFPCETCAGRGWVVVDAYTHRTIGTSETGVVQRVKALRCDSCGGSGAHGNGQRCADPPHGCGGSGWNEVPVSRITAAHLQISLDAPELGPGDPVLASLERREAAGDFTQLGLALAALRLEYRERYRLVVSVYVLGLREPDELPLDEVLRLQLALDYLLSMMPELIRVPSWAARNERRRRERLKRRRQETAA